MSLQSTIKYACPKCKHKQKITKWETVNVDLNPEIKQKILTGFDFFSQHCDRCGTKTIVFHSFLYHDMSRNLLIYFASDQDSYDSFMASKGKSFEIIHKLSPSKYTCRVIPGGWRSFQEKIHILDAGLDDRIIEFVKTMMAGFLAENAIKGCEPKDLSISFSEDVPTLMANLNGKSREIVGVDIYSCYKQMKEGLENFPDDSTEFKVIDHNWVASVT